MTERKRVQIVTPTRGLVRLELSLIREHLATSDTRYQLILGYADGQPVASNRNAIVKRLLESEPPIDYLLTIDSDDAPAFNPLDWVELDLDIVGVPTPTWQSFRGSPLHWIPGPPMVGAGIQQVDYVGGGMMLIARRVLEHLEMAAPFMDFWDGFGIRTEGEDQSFCRRAAACGFDVWCDFDNQLLHWQIVELCAVWDMLQGGKNGVSD